ncbi:YihY/virulence factor BrkB family protein [Microbispora triticiradicis]|uniref:YihY/virulence factor BrkB family protein n=3 Tax=Microbispora TaxID=2005 RepID=A0ABY3M437_9ACTN|nr:MULTISPECIES: YihY/virulence factor BrkB family protein [Microbispora]RGA05933.1 YihY/virulence factor BrkB family protein [Microbispora triticiradicis]TLP62220.1 YihY/virulence factor BrkB family protein [Microbispora fusca]TYB66328.1 YihY/virulence factor BrkB family protein [Microbispora tritici]
MRLGIVEQVTRRVDAVKATGRVWIERNRIRFRALDHLIRTVQRYQVQTGDRLAGAITYFAFLSFFPLIALAFALFGYVVTIRPDALATLTEAINSQLPGLAGQLHIDQLAGARARAGLIGLLGLVYAGLGAMDALRGALRTVWMTCEPPLNYFVGKLRDLVALVLMGVVLLASVIASGFATGATSTVAGWLGLGSSPLAGLGVWLAGVAASLVADLLLFLVILGWLAKPGQPFLVVLKGALLGAVGFGVLKQLAALILSSTLHNPVYGTFAVVVGLLLWINLSARVILYAAAWTATATLGPPPEPTPLPSPATTPTTGPA